MQARILFLSSAMLLSVPLVAQVEPSASGGGSAPTTNDDEAMTLPPQVSGSFYPSEVGDLQRQNLLSIGLIFITSYDDNVLTGETARAVGAESFSILPTVSLSTLTGRANGILSYSPGFQFYHPTSDLNHVTQNLLASFSYRMSPRTSVGVSDSFSQNSTVFSQPYTFAGTTISGSGEQMGPVVLLPYANQLSDTTDAHIGYQISRTAMIGASGSFGIFDLSNDAQGQGLYNSASAGGSVYYDRRLGRSQYFGVNYRYEKTDTNPIASTTVSQYGTVFYTFYPSRSFSLSVSGGPEYTTTTAHGIAEIDTWAPSIVASGGWHNLRTNLAVSYARSVSTGWGLLGSFKSDNASLSGQREFTRKFIGGISGNYSNTRNETPVLANYNANGHLLLGRVGLTYRLAERFDVVGEYVRLHEDYGGIAVIAHNPDDDRVSVTFNYRFSRPLGR